NTLASINHQHHHVGIFNRLQCFDYGEFLYRIGDFAAFTYAGSIDEYILTSIAFHWNVNTVTRGAWHVINHNALFAKDTVSECRLTNVWTTNYRQFDWQALRVEVIFLFFFAVFF